MLARQKIVGPGQLVPAEPGQKPQKKPRGKKGPRMSLLRRIERLSHHNVQRFSGWCFAGYKPEKSKEQQYPRKSEKPMCHAQTRLFEI